MIIEMEKIKGSTEYAATDTNGDITALSFWQYQDELSKGFWAYINGKDVRQLPKKKAERMVKVSSAKKELLIDFNDSLFG